MRPIELFRHCPRCGSDQTGDQAKNTFRCAACGLVYYFNPAIAAAAFILNAQGQALFIRRAKEPAKGKLAIPGGFIDFDESAEDAVRREIREEVNLEVHELEYLCTQPNVYHYQEVTYRVLDLFFVATAAPGADAAPLDDVDSVTWVKPHEVRPDDLAFPSIRAALALYLERRAC